MFGECAQVRVELVHFLLVRERGLLAHALRIPLLPPLEEGDLRLGLAPVERLQAHFIAVLLLLLPAASCCRRLQGCQGLINNRFNIKFKILRFDGTVIGKVRYGTVSTYVAEFEGFI